MKFLRNVLCITSFSIFAAACGGGEESSTSTTTPSSPPPVANYSVVELPDLTDDQNWKRAEFHSMTWVSVSAAYAEEHGDGIEEYGRWIGKQFAPSWGEEGSGTPAGLIRGWYRNAAAWQGLEFEVMEATDGIVKARSNRPWASYFGEEDMYGLTNGEFELFLAAIYDEIAKHLGLDYEQEEDGDHLVITARRR